MLLDCKETVDVPESIFLNLLQDETIDPEIKIIILNILMQLNRNLDSLVPSILECLKTRVTPLKIASEQCLIRIFKSEDILKRFVDECKDLSLKRNLIEYQKRVWSRTVYQPQEPIVL